MRCDLALKGLARCYTPRQFRRLTVVRITKAGRRLLTSYPLETV